MILINSRKVSRAELAERFSVSPRTISRYLDVLIDAGVPIYTKSGVNGGVYLADDYRLDKSYLSEAETARLTAALEMTADEFGDHVNRAMIEKLESVNKTRDKDSYVIKQDALYIDCEYEQADYIRPKIKILSQAIENRRSVEIKYTDAHGYVSYRTIDPYTIVFKAGAWYVYAMCRLRGDFRLFKLMRISDMRATSKSFTVYESKLLEKLELEFYNEMYVDLEFEFYPMVRESVVDWLGTSAISERGTKLIATAEVPYNDALYRKLLSFGSSIKVINPRELADKLREEAQLMLNAYEE